MRSRLPQLGRRALNGRLAASAASATSACRSRSGTRWTPTATSTTSTRSSPRGPAAGRPADRRAPRLRRPTSGPARRVRRRARRDGHLGHLLPDARRSPGGWVDDPDLFARSVPRGPAAAEPRDHPHLAVLLPGPGRTLEHGAVPWAHAVISGWILDPDRKQDVQEQGQRRSPPPMHLLDDYGADAVRYWAAGKRARDRHRLRRGPAPGRAAPGHEAAATPPGSCSGPGRAGRSRGAPRPWTGPCWPGWPAWSTRPPPPSRATSRPAPSRPARPSSGASATTTWSWSRGGPTGRPARPAGVGGRRPAPGPGHAAAPVRARAALRHRGGVVVVAGWLGAPQPLAGRRPPAGATGVEGPARPWRRPPPSWPRSAGPRPPPRCPCAPPLAGSGSPPP